MEKTQNNYLLGDREPPEAVDDHGGEIGDLGDDDDPGEVMLIWAQLLAKLSSLGVLYGENQVKCSFFCLNYQCILSEQLVIETVFLTNFCHF